MRSLLSTALVALVVGAVAGATAGALAQSAPAAVSPVNADRVDGKHAVGANASRLARAGKLVATNTQGYLPSGILKGPLVRTLAIETVIAQEVHDGAIGDGLSVNADCPDGATVTGGGFSSPSSIFRLVRTNPEGDGWEVRVLKVEADPVSGPPVVRAYAVCLTVAPAAGLIVAGRR